MIFVHDGLPTDSVRASGETVSDLPGTRARSGRGRGSSALMVSESLLLTPRRLTSMKALFYPSCANRQYRSRPPSRTGQQHWEHLDTDLVFSS